MDRDKRSKTTKCAISFDVTVSMAIFLPQEAQAGQYGISPPHYQWTSTLQKNVQSQINSTSNPQIKKTSKLISHPHLCRKIVSTTGHITSHFISRLSWFYIVAGWTRGSFGCQVYSRHIESKVDQPPMIFLQYKPWKSNTKQRRALILSGPCH